MIVGGYNLDLYCANQDSGCPNNSPRGATYHGSFEGYNVTEARAKARMAGWLFKADDVLCPKCAEPYQRKPRYPGGRRL